VNAVAPGALLTRLNERLLAAGPEVAGKEFHERMTTALATGGTPLELGASLCAYLASPASDGVTGKLISAVWDDWRHFTKTSEQFANKDNYTLRRFVPKEKEG